jgi:hypothetical protein
MAMIIIALEREDQIELDDSHSPLSDPLSPAFGSWAVPPDPDRDQGPGQYPRREKDEKG